MDIAIRLNHILFPFTIAGILRGSSWIWWSRNEFFCTHPVYTIKLFLCELLLRTAAVALHYPPTIDWSIHRGHCARFFFIRLRQIRMDYLLCVAYLKLNSIFRQKLLLSRACIIDQTVILKRFITQSVFKIIVRLTNQLNIGFSKKLEERMVKGWTSVTVNEFEQDRKNFIELWRTPLWGQQEQSPELMNCL